MSSRSTGAAAGVFLTLVAARNRGVWSYLLHTRGVFDAVSIRTILRHDLLPACGAGLICLLAWGLGLLLLRLLRADTVEECDLMGFGLGLGALASAGFLMGLCGFFSTTAFGLLGALAFVPGLDGLLRRARREPRPAPGTAGSLWQGALAGFMAFLAWHALTTALAPATDWDVLAYHLTLPKLYLKAGRISEIPWLLQSHWPHLMEVLYAGPIALGLDNAAALIHAAVCAALVLAVFRVGRDRLGAPAAWIGAGLLAAQSALWRCAGTAHSDGALALFHFLACVALWSWAESGSRGKLALAGLLSGLGACAKLLGILPLAVLAAWVCLRPRREKRLAAVLLFASCGLAVVLPWYIKTWIGAGNPVWPFLSNRLGGLWGAAFLEPPFLRINLFGWPPEPALLLRYGPQFLLVPAAAGAAWAGWRRIPWPPFLLFLLTPAFFYFLVVARDHEGWRFMLSMMPALALTTGWALTRCGRGRAGGFAAAALVLFGLYPGLRATQNNELFAVLGLRSTSRPDVPAREVYLERSLDHYGFYQRLLPMVGAQDRILLFQEIRGYYLDADFLWGDPRNQGLIRYAELAGPAQLAARLRELGVTHVLVNADNPNYSESPDYYDSRTLAMMRGLLRWRGQLILREGGLALYRITD